MGTTGRKDLSRLIVPHCLHPQALCCDGVLFCCGFLTTACGFRPRNMSASLQGSGHKFCGLCLPISRSQPCPGSWPSYNPPLSTCVFHMYIIPTILAQIPRCKTETTQIIQISGQGESCLYVSLNKIEKPWQDPLTDYFVLFVFRSWQLRMKAAWVKTPWRFRGLRDSLRLLLHHLNPASSCLYRYHYNSKMHRCNPLPLS